MVAEKELEQVERWREQRLLDAGFPLEEARLLALCSDVDLHRAVELVRQGCLPVTAAKILL